MNYRIQKLAAGDLNLFVDLIRVFEDVFEMTDFNCPDNAYLAKLIKKEGFSVFVAIQDDRVIAGLTAYMLDSYYVTGSYLYIYDLAVMTKYQRKGIGKAVISAVLNHYQQSSVTEVFVQADLVDDYAIDFYRSTGGKEDSVVSFSYQL